MRVFYIFSKWEFSDNPKFIISGIMSNAKFTNILLLVKLFTYILSKGSPVWAMPMPGATTHLMDRQLVVSLDSSWRSIQIETWLCALATTPDTPFNKWILRLLYTRAVPFVGFWTKNMFKKFKCCIYDQRFLGTYSWHVPLKLLVNLVSCHNLCYHVQMERLSAGLLALGVKPGDRVGIWSPNRAEWSLTKMATANIGVILVSGISCFFIYSWWDECLLPTFCYLPLISSRNNF